MKKEGARDLKIWELWKNVSCFEGGGRGDGERAPGFHVLCCEKSIPSKKNKKKIALWLETSFTARLWILEGGLGFAPPQHSIDTILKVCQPWSYPVFVLGQMNLSSVECWTKLSFIFQFSVISGVAGCLLNQLSDLHCVPRSFVSEQMHSQLAGDEMCADADEGNQWGAQNNFPRCAVFHVRLLLAALIHTSVAQWKKKKEKETVALSGDNTPPLEPV